MNERDIFLAALDIESPAARREFLDRACQGNSSLRGSVEALFRSHESTDSFLQTPLVKVSPEAPAEITEGDLGGSTPIDDTVRLSPAQMDSDDDEVALGFLSPSTRPGSLGQLAHYEILEVLGQGAFGTVLKGFDEKLHRMVAIKIMSTELASTSPARKRFLREARSAAAIRHENVVAIYAVEEKPLPYLVMEYIPGQTLQQLLDDNGPLDLAMILKLGHQMAEGLAAAHSQGLVHRDIKPANILLEDGVQMRVKITDFGLARAADDATLTQSGIIAGTPMYMSPEQAHGLPINQRSDLFSLGSVLYQMVTGRPPFRAATTLAVLKRVTEDTPRAMQEIIPETPDWLVAIISKLLAKSPDERFQSTTELADLLARCRDELKHKGKVTSIHSLIPTAHARVAPVEAKAAAGPSAGSLWRQLAAAAFVVLMIVGSVVLFQNSNSTQSQTGQTSDSKKVASQPDLSPIVRTDDTHRVLAKESIPALAPFDTTQEKRQKAKPSAASPTHRGLPAEYTNSIGMKFVIVQKGKSWLSGGKDKLGDKEVEIPADFYLGKHEVTQEQWEKVMGENPSYFSRTGSGRDEVKNLSDADLKLLPVDSVTWDHCQHFIERLNKSEAETGWVYRLPKEIEWEYACRGGSMAENKNSAFDFYLAAPMNNLMPVNANFNNGTVENYVGINRTSKVGSFAPNTLGLHDMHGNLWEWCADSDKTPDGASGFANRGGSWDSPDYACTATCRAIRIPSNMSQSHGLRLVRAQLYDAETRRIAALPAAQQVAEVREELMRRNPGFDGELSHSIENGAVVALKFSSDRVRDITPLSALKQLHWLDCSGVSRVGEVTDLSPLIGLPLNTLNCQSNMITDLAPLKGMKLSNLICSYNPISDLSPIKDMPLKQLRCEDMRVADISPLKGMPLTIFCCSYNPISDLSPLKGMPLSILDCNYTSISDLTLLKNMPLKELRCQGTRVADLSPLKGLSFSIFCCGFTPISDLSPLTDMPLKELRCEGTQVADLSALKAMRLSMLYCSYNPITDLSPLTGMPLKELRCQGTRVADLSPLRGMRLISATFEGTFVSDLIPLEGMPLEEVSIGNGVTDLSPLKGTSLRRLTCAGATKLIDLAPLKGMALQFLNLQSTGVSDLSVLNGMPLEKLIIIDTNVVNVQPLKNTLKLEYLHCDNSITDLSPLKELPLKWLLCDFQPARDANILRSIKSLVTINDKPVAEFWKGNDQVESRN